MLKNTLRMTLTATAITGLVVACGGEPESAPADAPEAMASSSVACMTGADAAALAERPSPLESATIMLGGQEVKVCYGAPSARERQVMGGLVPMGQPWRMGANEPTMIHLPMAATIGGVAAGPGSVSLYAIPGDESWEIVVNGSIERWGVPINEEVRAADIGSFTVTPEMLDSAVETLTMAFEAVDGGAHLVMDWEMTRIRIPVEAAEG